MEKATIAKLNKSFEEYAYVQDGIDYWLARELQELLGYADWRNFLNAVEKAKESCKITGEAVIYHFVDITKMIELGKGGKREVEDIIQYRNKDRSSKKSKLSQLCNKILIGFNRFIILQKIFQLIKIHFKFLIIYFS